MKLDELLSQIEKLSPQGIGFKPHKYLLLLTLIEQIQTGQANDNRFVFDQTFRDVFTAQFNRYHRPDDSNRPWTPFFHLSTSGFWHLKAKPDSEDVLSKLSTIGGPKEITDHIEYGYFDDAIFELLREPHTCDIIKGRILTILQERLSSNAESVISEDQTRYKADYRAPAPFQHEEIAIRQIETGISPTGRLVSNVQLYDDQTRGYYECDLILVGHSGLYVVELKHWSGHIRVLPRNWVINQYVYREDPHLSNKYKCQLLKGMYQHQFRVYPNIWVRSIVVLTNPEAVVEGADSPLAAAAELEGRGDLIFGSTDDFIAFFRKRDTAAEAEVLSDTQVEAVATFLRSIGKRLDQKQYSIPGYETVKYLSQRPECIELVARPLNGRVRGLSRFRVFLMPDLASPLDRQRARRKANNTIESVCSIGEHPNIHRVNVVPNENGDVIEISDWSEAGTLKDMIDNRKGAFPVDEALTICRGIASALAAAHQAGIIHRAVKPEHILMMNGIPKLTNFDISYHTERAPGEPTVLPNAGGLKDDGYTAPELLDWKDIDEGTDLFSLGVIAYQLLTGEKPFSAVRKLTAQGGRLTDSQLRKLSEKGVPDMAIAAIRDAVVSDWAARLKDAHAMEESFRTENVTAEYGSARVVNPRLEPGAQHDLFEIEELVGEGSEAQVYRARTHRQELVAIKLFHREVPRERIFAEETFAESLRSDHVVHLDGRMGHWNNDRYFLVMEYVEGETLRKKIERGERPDSDAFRRVVLGMMDALKAFHQRRNEEGELSPLVHGDVKPDNILIRRDGEPLLIDFSVTGSPRIDEFQGTAGYVPPDRILGTEMQFAPDGDLFALGVTLWEWVYGRRPYESPAIGDVPVRPKDISTELPNEWLDWLDRAVGTKEDVRFGSVEEMHAGFLGRGREKVETQKLPMGTTDGKHTVPDSRKDTVDAVHKDTEPAPDIGHLNPFVAYLNTLTSASAGNDAAIAEAHISNPYFQSIHVPNPLTETVLERLVEQRGSMILTGNAGDGKTTIAAEVHERLAKKPMEPSPIVEIPESGVVIVKDMSELPESQRTEVLEKAAAGNQTYLIVSNTGTLLKAARGTRIGATEPHQVQSDLLRALEADDAVPVLGERFLLLNVGRTDSIDTALAVFEKMLNDQNWEACNSCPVTTPCHIYTNVRLIQANPEMVLRRIELIYRRLYEYGVRLTMRQMVGHLAYALTGGKGCSQVRRLGEVALEAARVSFLFSNRFFGDDGQAQLPEADQLLPVRRLRDAGFGVMLEPLFERGAWSNNADALPLTGEALGLARKLRGDGEIVGPEERAQIRRLVYFFAPLMDEARKQYIATFLQSPTLLEYLRITRQDRHLSARDEAKWRDRVLQVLQEHFTGVKLPEDYGDGISRIYLTLNRRSSASSTQMVLAELPTDDFKVCLKRGHRSVPGSSERLVLRWKDEQLALDLPFLDYVARRYQGEVAARLSAFYLDRLERFRAALLENQQGGDASSLRLLRLGPDRRLTPTRIIFSRSRLEVL